MFGSDQLGEDASDRHGQSAIDLLVHGLALGLSPRHAVIELQDCGALGDVHAEDGHGRHHTATTVAIATISAGSMPSTISRALAIRPCKLCRECLRLMFISGVNPFDPWFV